MIIYKVTHTLDGKVYIGQTIKPLKKRWSEHGYKKKNTYFSNCLRKYGKENFSIEQIDQASSLEELNEKEVYWINFFDSTNKEKGYNIEHGGNSHKKSQETIEKQRRSMIGKNKYKRTEEARLNMSLAQMGKKRAPFSEEHKDKIRQKALGRKHTSQAKEKIREAKTGRKLSIEEIQKREETKRKNRLQLKENLNE